MAKTCRLSPVRHGVTFAVMALVLLASAMVPRGYMIAPSETGGLHITACPHSNPFARMVAHTQREEQSLAHAAMGHHMDDADDEVPTAGQSGSDCAFAGFSAQGVAQAMAVWDAPFGAYASLAPPIISKKTKKRSLRLRPSLRGPPIRL